jgi:isoleucyl-tRNA synthetase
VSEVNFKNTLNLPKTKFPMKANLPQTEPQIEALWQNIKIYEKLQKKNRGRQKFILHDGPPYANGDIHIGHALNKILKDIIVRYKSMSGYDSPFVPGWDCHGLPVELQLLKQLSLKKHQIEKSDFRKKAKNFALKFVDTQRRQFERLGVLGDWSHPYLTLDKEYEAQILHALSGLVRDNFIYKGLKPVNWCCHCETALAEAEVEYQEATSPSIFVKFKLINSEKLISEEKNEAYLIIWTTTPWTLLANVACAINPNLTYIAVRVKKEIWVCAKALIEKILEVANESKYEVLKEIKAEEIEGLKYQHPFFERQGVVVLADYVSGEEGSGIVHIAPGHGQEDYLTGLKYRLPVIMPVDEKGNFDKNQGEFSSLSVQRANGAIIEKLNELNLLINASQIRHSYPHCWRCKHPIIFRATSQYFMKIDHRDLRKRLLSIAGKEVGWIPPQGKERIQSMIETRPDWCLSRQRFWGIPIPAFYCLNCKAHILDAKIIEHIVSLVRKEGSDVWFKMSEVELLPDGFKCPKCKGNKFKKEEDILDVWFESGVSHQSVLKQKDNLNFPADLYLEGSDQHRGWFQSSLITSVALENKAPYRQVLTHGFVVDGEGRKMSKSLGNVITPHQIIKDLGADILRLWVASSNYNEDVRISDEILKRLSEAYRKIRNTFRFILGNLYDFNKEGDLVNHHQLEVIDRWAISKLSSLLKEVDNFYKKYDFLKVFQAIYHFCVVELSSFYLDILKDRLYTFASKSIERKSAQSALFYILEVLTRIIAPIMPFTAEEVWQHVGSREVESIHLLDWPRQEEFEFYRDSALERDFEKLLLLRKDATKELEKKREEGLIGNSLEAKITIFVKSDSENKHLLEKYYKMLNSYFIVSQAEVKSVDSLDEGEMCEYFEDSRLMVERASGSKCARCWNYTLDVGKNEVYLACLGTKSRKICQRCINALREEGGRKN